MRLYINLIFTVLFLNLNCLSAKAEMTLKELIFDDTKTFNLKILDAIPDVGKIQIGSNNAKHTIIEFFDYFCGYCKKIHAELVELTQSRDDVRVIFLQHPILSESSKVLSKMVVAANYENKGFDLHHAIFSISGSINKEKLDQAIVDSDLDPTLLRIKMDKNEIEKTVQISSFLAGGIGARGTPAIFINEHFYSGYIPKDQIIRLLK